MLIRYSEDEEEKKDEEDVNFFQEVNVSIIFTLELADQ